MFSGMRAIANPCAFPAKSFHEKAGECQVGFFFFLGCLFFLSIRGFAFEPSRSLWSPPFHPHSWVERLSLGASWVYSIQSFRAFPARETA